MIPRWFAVLLSLFLAAPLCCCGWHQAVAEEALTCPMCQGADSSHEAGDDTCPCSEELIQRDLAPKTVHLFDSESSFACLSETLVGQLPSLAWAKQSQVRFQVAVRSSGPPRWYLKYRALLC
jgi:hypothetical protein